MNIWYACYGSNLLEERFLCYIRGGTAPGTSRTYEGCSDQALPLENEKIIIRNALYFAKHSETWSGGVAFIGNHTKVKANTLGRMYLITSEQFEDILKQEIDSKEPLSVNIADLILREKMLVRKGSWYGNVLFLGFYNEIPIVTFTHEVDLPPAKPSPSYLKVIADGIRETYDYEPEEIAEYFLETPGVHGFYTREEILDILKQGVTCNQTGK